jgi:imidazolonepropionase-like amidohydrolase
LKNFVAAGWSVREALVAATKTNAEILDMDDRLGTLAPGKLAVLLVDGRLDENLDELSGLDLVIRDGCTVVEGGKVTIPRHLVTPQAKKAQ